MFFNELSYTLRQPCLFRPNTFLCKLWSKSFVLLPMQKLQSKKLFYIIWISIYFLVRHRWLWRRTVFIYHCLPQNFPFKILMINYAKRIPFEIHCHEQCSETKRIFIYRTQHTVTFWFTVNLTADFRVTTLLRSCMSKILPCTCSILKSFLHV